MSQITENDNPSLDLTKSEQKKADKITEVLEELIALRKENEDKETKLKVELKELLKPAYFKFNEDNNEPEDVVHTFDLDNLQVNFTKAYFIKNSEHLQELINLLGPEHPLVDTIFQGTRITIDVSELDEKTANKLATEVTKVTVAYDIKPEVERCSIVTEEFHNFRHIYLTKEDNLLVDEVLPLNIQVTPIR